MSFSSLLSQITKDKNLPPNSRNSKGSTIEDPSRHKLSSSSKGSNGKPINNSSRSPYQLDADPAVARLKEARRLEKEKLQAIRDAKKPPRTKISGSSSSSNNPGARKQPTKSYDAGANSSKSARPQTNRSATSSRHSTPVRDIRKTSPGPKLSFKELMKQAETLNTSQLAVNLVKTTPTAAGTVSSPQKKNKPEPGRLLKAQAQLEEQARIRAHADSIINNRRSRTENKPSYDSKTRPRSKNLESRIPTQKSLPPVPSYKPSGFAKPSDALMKKLDRLKPGGKPNSNRAASSSVKGRAGGDFERRKKDSFGIDAESDDEDDDVYYGYRDEEYDSELDDFIDYENDHESAMQEAERRKRLQRKNALAAKNKGYDRDEIWSIFNRGGHKRAYSDEDDEDDDDMEATGAEILEEEERTLKQAKLDDIREQRLIEKRQLEKQKRLKGG